MTFLVAIAVIVVLALFGLPLFLVLGGASLLGYLASSQSLELFFASNFAPVATSPIFVAIPLYTLAGYMMAESRAPERMVNLSRAALSWLPGGLAMVALVACAGFTAFTGASGVTIIALGGLLLPALLKDGYEERFSIGLLTTSGSRGLVFPPSLPLIVYAMIAGLALQGQRAELGLEPQQAPQVQKEGASKAEEELDEELEKILEEDEDSGDQGSDEGGGAPAANRGGMATTKGQATSNRPTGGPPPATGSRLESMQVSVDRLFVAGALPGLLSIFLVALYAFFKGPRQRRRESFDIRRLGRALRDSAFELPVALIIVVGIYGGFVTAIDASAIVAAYVFVIEVLVYRDIPLRRLPAIFRESMVLVGGILLILMSALSLTNFFIDREVPQTIFRFVKGFISSPISFLMVLNVFLLVVGCLMDIFSAILVVVPMITPLALHYGVNPVHLGIIFLTNLEIGYSTPPVGLNLFVASLAFKRPVVELYRAALPFLWLSVIALLLITYWPDLSLALVRWTGVQ